VHGAVFYAVAGAAVAAAANDDENSGIISSVLVEYLQPAALGDVLRAEVSGRCRRAARTSSPGPSAAGTSGDPLAWVRARGTRRTRSR
jgi:acyl-CoA thioesterase